jgi:hyaluronan synthase
LIGAIVQIVFAIPMFVMAMNFGVSLLMRSTVRSTFIQKDYRLQPTVSVLLPSYNEGQHVFKTIESILASDYPVEKLEVVAIDDYSSDDTYEWLQRAAERWPNVRAFRNETNSGKHYTLSRALSESTGEILICIDSDCLFDRRAVKELTSCFADPAIGAVGGRVGVSNPAENVLTHCQTLMYYYAYQITKMTQNWARNVMCISGCLFAVRREHFLAIEKTVKERNWFGIGVRDGEDRYMTHLLLLKGLKTYSDIEAQCWTAAPNNLKQLFMQQLRWRRGSLRDFFWTLRTFHSNIKVLNPLVVINTLAAGSLTILWPAMHLYMLLAATSVDEFFVSLQVHVLLYIAAGAIFNLYVRVRNPEQRVNPFAVWLLGIWFVLDFFFLTILALATFDVGEWGTRGAPAPRTKTGDERSASSR